jgi:hypothetical protein
MKDLVLFCQKWAKYHGYAVSKTNSARGKNVYITCDHSGLYCGSAINPSSRKTATMKVNCLFQLKGSVPTSKKITKKLWTLEIRHGKHNHDLSPGSSSHAAHRQLLPEQVEEIWKLSKAKLKPSQILLQLQTDNKEILATNKTITNTLQKICLEDLAGGTPIEALMCVFKESNWSCNVKLNSSGKLLNLFFAQPGSIHLARINHHVALLDATYKTNRYKLPLIYVIGQAASN